jgi:hypothetical protein
MRSQLWRIPPAQPLPPIDDDQLLRGNLSNAKIKYTYAYYYD